MDDKVAYWVSMVLGAIALLSVGTSIVVTGCNRTLQTEVNQRQAKINTSVGLSQLNQSLVQALADVSAKDDDKDIRDLLAAQGITFKARANAENQKK